MKTFYIYFRWLLTPTIILFTWNYMYFLLKYICMHIHTYVCVYMCIYTYIFYLKNSVVDRTLFSESKYLILNLESH